MKTPGYTSLDVWLKANGHENWDGGLKSGLISAGVGEGLTNAGSLLKDGTLSKYNGWTFFFSFLYGVGADQNDKLNRWKASFSESELDAYEEYHKYIIELQKQYYGDEFGRE